MDNQSISGTVKSSTSAKSLPKCVCSWKNCRTYQKAYNSVCHPVLDGVVRVKLIKGDTASIPFKASVDRTLKVPKEKRQAWQPAKGEEIIRYNIARHHFTDAHVQKYLKDPKRYKWTNLFSTTEAKKYLFKMDLKETISLGDSDVYYVQCPNVSKEHVKAEFLKMKEEMEKSRAAQREKERQQRAAAAGGDLSNYLNTNGKTVLDNQALIALDNSIRSGNVSSIRDDPTIASHASDLLANKEAENARLRKELEECKSQLTYLNEMLRQLQEGDNENSRRSSRSRTVGGKGPQTTRGGANFPNEMHLPHEVMVGGDESLGFNNDVTEDWSEGIDEDDTINDDESSGFAGAAGPLGQYGNTTKDKNPKSAWSRASIVSASQTVKSLPREVELADLEAASGSDDSSMEDAFDDQSYVSRGSRVSRASRSVASKRGEGSRQKGKRRQKGSNKSVTSEEKKGEVETYEVKQQVIVDPYGEKGNYAGSLSKATGMPHGKGRLEYAAGRWYEGDWKHGRWTGQGRLSNGDGDLYEGELRNDHKHGHGTMRFADGRVFVGEYVNGQMVQGKMTYQDGSTYEGGWMDGMRHSRGRCVFTDRSIYDGEFKEGEFHGFGKMEWSDGGWYEGEWWNGEMHGQGKEVRPNGSLRHEGAWTKGQPIRKRDPKKYSG